MKWIKTSVCVPPAGGIPGVEQERVRVTAYKAESLPFVVYRRPCPMWNGKVKFLRWCLALWPVEDAPTLARMMKTRATAYRAAEAFLSVEITKGEKIDWQRPDLLQYLRELPVEKTRSLHDIRERYERSYD